MAGDGQGICSRIALDYGLGGGGKFNRFNSYHTIGISRVHTVPTAVPNLKSKQVH